MSWRELDFIFPFVVFGYGAVMTFVLNMPVLMDAAEKRIQPDVLRLFSAHRKIGFVCLLVGAVWSLQNLLLG